MRKQIKWPDKGSAHFSLFKTLSYINAVINSNRKFLRKNKLYSSVLLGQFPSHPPAHFSGVVAAEVSLWEEGGDFVFFLWWESVRLFKLVTNQMNLKNLRSFLWAFKKLSRKFRRWLKIISNFQIFIRNQHCSLVWRVKIVSFQSFTQITHWKIFSDWVHMY